MAPGNHNKAFTGNFFWSPYWDTACPSGRMEKPLSDEKLRRAWQERVQAAGGRMVAVPGRSLARAAELARWLPPESLATLAGALEAVCARMPAHKQAERSLLARCILETDPEQRTRFEFLALEGRMEAAAAEAWAARLQEAS